MMRMDWIRADRLILLILNLKNIEKSKGRYYTFIICPLLYWKHMDITITNLQSRKVTD